MIVGYDSAARIPSLPGIFKLRYLGYPGDYRRYSPEEQAADRAAGCVTVMILEDNGYMNGYAQGQKDGTKAVQLMRELGRDPGTEAIVFTIDHGPPYDWNAIAQYMEGVKSVGCGRPIFYGPTDVGDWLVDNGHAVGVWVAGAWSWSPGYNGRPPACRHAVGWQYPKYVSVGGVTCDYNEFYDLNWIHGGASGPATPSQPGEEDMTPDQYIELLEKWTGLSKADVEGGLTIVKLHEDTRSQIPFWLSLYTGIEKPNGKDESIVAKLTEPGWSSRPYAFQKKDDPSVYVIERFPTGKLLAGGSPEYAFGRMHIASQRTSEPKDSPRLLGILVRMGLNPNIQTVDDDADWAEIEALPVLNVA